MEWSSPFQKKKKRVQSKLILRTRWHKEKKKNLQTKVLYPTPRDLTPFTAVHKHTVLVRKVCNPQLQTAQGKTQKSMK